MPLVPKTGLKVSGFGHEELIRQLKQYYDKTRTAQVHLLTAGRIGATITLERVGGHCGAKPRTKEVTISWDACQAGLHTINYLAESALFELQNAINHRRFLDIEENLENGTITVLGYGLSYAELEAEATITTATIISQLEMAPTSHYTPSPWGEKQVKTYFEQQANFEDYFVNQPHDENATGLSHLKSKHFYAHKEIAKYDIVDQLINILESAARIKPVSGSENWRTVKWIMNDFASNNSQLSMSELLSCYILTLNSLGKSTHWNVTWGRDWLDYTNDLIANNVTIVNNTIVDKMKRKFENNKQYFV